MTAVVALILVWETSPLAIAPAQASDTSSACPGIESAQVYPFDAPAVSHGGRAIAFTTAAALVDGDTNGELDVYVWEPRSNKVERVSVRTDNTQADHASRAPAISANGRFVAFESAAPLDPRDDDGVWPDVFVYDRHRRILEQVSVAPDGAASLGESSRPSMSADGRAVAFRSTVSNLVAGDENDAIDVYVRDLDRQQTIRASIDPEGKEFRDRAGTWGLDISGDGNVVAFHQGDQIYARDLTKEETTEISTAFDGGRENDESTYPSISGDGRYVAFASSSTNIVPDDRNSDGNEEGLIVSTHTDVFVHDRMESKTKRVSVAADGMEAEGSSHQPSISADGRSISFESSAANLSAGDDNDEFDVFVHDTAQGSTQLISAGAHGTDDDGTDLSFGSLSSGISPDGMVVAFVSDLPGLVPGDDNGAFDVFVHGLPGAKRLVWLETSCTAEPSTADASTDGTTATTGAVDGRPMSVFSGTREGHVLLLGGVALFFLLVMSLRSGKPRRATAGAAGMILVAALVLPSVPAAAHHYKPIQPGAQINEESGACSMNFVFRDGNGRLFVGTAAHCIRGSVEHGGVDGIVGGRVFAEGLGEFGTTVYGRYDFYRSVNMDFVLIEVDRDKHEFVDPTLRAWGGPSGVQTEFRPGMRTMAYGFGTFLRNSEPTRAKSGHVVKFHQEGRWQGWLVDNRPATGGDSGSPVVTGDGKAAAITITIGLAYNTPTSPGSELGPSLQLILKELRLAGLDVELATADFPASPTLIAEHCAQRPIDDSRRGDGCIRSNPGP